MRRKSKYPRVIFDNEFQRVVQTARDAFVWERSGYDELGERRWTAITPDDWPVPPRRIDMLLEALAKCADRKRRRRRRTA